MTAVAQTGKGVETANDAGARDRRPTSALTFFGVAMVVASALMLVSAPLGYRLQIIPLRTALLGMLAWGAFAGLAGVLVSLAAAVLAKRQGRRGFWLAVLGVVIGVASVGMPLAQQRAARWAPPIHDITTDTVEPPAFVDVLPLRADAPNSVEYGGEPIAAQQRAAYPDLVPLTVDLAPAVAFARVLDAVQGLGWELVAAVPEEGRIEATDTTFWFGFKDDVVVRIRPRDGGSVVDARSVSRIGVGDVGTNAARLRALFARLTAASGP
jgi:uncharacterized protein (DUF1499 family)/uncharacterized membrane protein YvlD (DUF360 family)